MGDRAWISWSSGKDAAWALYVARTRLGLDVTRMLTTVTRDYGRVSMHAVRQDLLFAQAQSVGLPVYMAYIPARCASEDYEKVMRKALDAAHNEGVAKMVFGDLLLEDVRAYRVEKMADTGIEPVFPLWGSDTHALAGEMLSAGAKAVITCIDPRKLPREFAGRQFDMDFLKSLPEGVDPCGENGEFHTFAWDGPAFAHPVRVRTGETVEREGFIFTDVLAED